MRIEMTSGKRIRIEPDNENLFYSGRIDWSNPKAPVFIFPCTFVQMRFTGDFLKIFIENRNVWWDNYLGYILDGKQGKILLPPEGAAEFEIEVEEYARAEHEFLLFKRQDACHEAAFLGAEIGMGEEILPCHAKTKRRIEVYGDSVSAGEVSEAVSHTGMEDPVHNGEYSNSWYSYAWMTARKLNAQIHNIAQGGIALMDRTGWFCEPDAYGMESVWDKLHYNPAFGRQTQWDFSNYVPHAVIVAIGQNDSHPLDYMKEDYEGAQSKAWRQHYKAFLEKLRNAYPKAHIICCTTLLYHDDAWDKSIGQAVRELHDDRIVQHIFRRNGRGTPGHLRIEEAQEMADELAECIEKLDIEGWGGFRQ